MRSTTRDAEFTEWVRGRRGHLIAVARTLTHGDTHRAEDIVQAVLVKLYLKWDRLERRSAVDAYARRALVNAFIDESRRPAGRFERASGEVPETGVSDVSEQIDPELLAALAALPARMRAAVVLRHVVDLSVEETAAALRCSPGTVKSQTARGLDKLRDALPSPTPAHTAGEAHE